LIKFTDLPLTFYTIFVFLYTTGIKVSSWWNTKARLWVKGRENIFSHIASTLNDQNAPVIWMHCASLGEFEQGKPVLEELKSKNEKIKIVLTFFSPSGYENVKNYTGADHIFYLPMDSAKNSRKFIDIVQPKLVLWVKYEYWYYFLQELKKRNIPVLLISGIFREDQPFFKWYGKIWKDMLQCFTHFFVQNEESKKLLESAGITKNVEISGDTRFDRVINIAETFEPVDGIEQFCDNKNVIVAGSTWEDDEAELIHFVRANPQIKFIIAPHEIGIENLQDVKKEFSNSIFYTELISGNTNEQTHNCLIIDNIGMLSRLYHYADITYVGGGFGDDGVHNVLEAAVYGKPVFFGPVYEKFIEASELIEYGGGFSINNALELEKEFTALLNNENELKKAGEYSKEYVYSKAGATKKILKYIYENRLLIN
jgi:3-deoxy-D-manno-octulosonic-acid transferase